MGYYVSFTVFIIAITLYRRYAPIWRVRMKRQNKIENAIILDVRAYNEPATLQKTSMRIPSAYLQRYYQEIPRENLHVIASDRAQVNMSLRFLLKRRFQVASYEILDEH